jgi:hypothetical protein
MNRREYIQNTALGLGYALSFGAVAAVFESCKTDTGSDQNNLLSASQFKLLEELTETILPKTSTLGAKDTNCALFIQKLVADVYNEKDKKEFLDGLASINEQCKTATGKTFIESNVAEREAFLTKLDEELPKFPPSMWGIVLVKNTEPVGFFRHLKSATLMAYFTSKELSEYNKSREVHG